MTRIVFVISHLIYGGAETQLINLTKELASRNHAVAIYTLNAANPRASELKSTGVELIPDQKRFKLDFAVLWRLHRFIKQFRADIVHGFLFDGDIYSRLASVGTGAIAVNSERNSDYSLSITQKFAHRCTRFLAHAVVANSYAGARFARTLFALPPGRIHTVWNGIDLNSIDGRTAEYDVRLHELFFEGTNFKIACLVGSIKPPKDYRLALEVADVLTRNHPDWRVLFIGEQLSTTGPYKSEILQFYSELALEGRAAFAGLRQDVPELISRCRVLFSTSLYEGFPNVVLEAMTVGTPVVSTHYSDIRQILPEPWQVIPDRNPSSIVSAILRADIEHSCIVAAQRAWVAKNATISIAADNLESIYLGYVPK